MHDTGDTRHPSSLLIPAHESGARKLTKMLDGTRPATRFGLFRASSQSYSDFLLEKWVAACRGLGVDTADTVPAVEEIRGVLSPWGSRQIGDAPRPPSFVSADGFPAEMSLSWTKGRREVRLLWESLGEDATARSCQDAGRALTRRLADKPGVCISDYLHIEDLFVTPDPATYRPTVWHALAWQPGKPIKYKAYLNPQVHGADHAAELVGEAMRRLDLSTAWQSVGRHARQLAERGHELEFFAMDLADRAKKPRVKIYFRHHDMPPAELDAVASFARRHDPVRGARARRIIYGHDDGTITNEPMTCLAFRHGTAEPEEANVYLRLLDNTRSDAEAGKRVTELMRVEGIDPRPYQGALDALAPAPTHTTTGLQDLLSYRTIDDQSADLGLYLRFSTYGQPAVNLRLDQDRVVCSRWYFVIAGNTPLGRTPLHRFPGPGRPGPVFIRLPACG